ncbi:MAG TPA: hypothetical protein VFY56_13040 [Propionibacteriaceae bacterium]|nr:hypothetical protein [Propionibacteriaceae bacterium]
MAGDFTDLPAFDAFDAIAVISHASCTLAVFKPWGQTRFQRH